MKLPGALTAGSYIPPTSPPLQVPPAVGVPPRTEKRFTGIPFAQIGVEASVPAVGGAGSVTVTVAVAFAQGAVPLGVYTKLPGAFTAGSYIPPTSPPLQVPPAVGVPPSTEKRFTGMPFSQIAVEASVPAFGGADSVTVIDAVAFAQGAVPLTV